MDVIQFFLLKDPPKYTSGFVLSKRPPPPPNVNQVVVVMQSYVDSRSKCPWCNKSTMLWVWLGLTPSSALCTHLE